MTLAEDIFLVPHRDRYLLHAPRHGVTALMNAALAAELRAVWHGESMASVSPHARRLAQALRDAVPLAIPLRTGPFAPRSVSLMPTTDCNMRCLYCAPAAGGPHAMTMSPEVCTAALRYQAGVVRREGHATLMVYFFGGEPFVAWDLVQHCDAEGRALAGALGVPYHSACTTNAFMSEERARWVARHLAFVLVSLDGDAETHDRYRPAASGAGTHATVVRSLRIFGELGLPYALRCSVDAALVARLPEVVEYLCREFRPVAINLEPLVEHGRCLEAGLHSPPPGAFVTAMVASGRVARSHRVPLKLTMARIERLAQSNCDVAQDSFIVAPDGTVSACFGVTHRDSPHAPSYAFGEIDGPSGCVTLDPDRLARVRGYGVAGIPRCRGCFAKWHCAGGCRIFHTPPGCEAPPGPMCQVTQALTRWRILECLGLHAEADLVSVEDAW